MKYVPFDWARPSGVKRNKQKSKKERRKEKARKERMREKQTQLFEERLRDNER